MSTGVAGRTKKQYNEQYREQNAEQIKLKKLMKQQSDAIKWNDGDITIKMSFPMFEYLTQYLLEQQQRVS